MLFIYFFRDDPISILSWAASAVLWVLGGWLIAAKAFSLTRGERVLVGTGIGLVGYIAAVNLLGRWINPEIAFVAAAFVVLLIGLVYAGRSHQWMDSLRDFGILNEILVGMVLFVIFLSLGAGLGIFDDRKNLSLISTMAAGNIPPLSYLNSQELLRYHYGSQLLGASLMRLGGLFPWSAFDVSKAMLWSLMALLNYLLWKRFAPDRRWAIVSTLAVLFAGGTRYLLLFMPKGVLLGMDGTVDLIGTSANVGLPFSKALQAAWSIDDGPPFPYPFAFQNGLFRTTLMEHAGTGTLSSVIFITLWLIKDRIEGWKSLPIIVLLFAVWALVWESSYGLFSVGVVISAMLSKAWDKEIPEGLKLFLAAVLISVPFALVQGGTITAMARDLITGFREVSPMPPSLAEATGFGLRWPPAIVSAHLGELHLGSPLELLVAIFEMGPIILLAPWIISHSMKEFARGKWFVGALSFGAMAGFLLPILVTYQSDRDITRLTGYALDVWLLLLVRMLWTYTGPWKEGFNSLGTFSLGLMAFGGVVLAGTQLTAVPERMTTAHFTELDARVVSEVWDKLPEGAEILDHRGWRAVALTGRLTHPFERSALRATGDCGRGGCLVDEIIGDGFDFLYYDNWWLEQLSEEEQASLSASCIYVVTDQRYGRESYRRLLDLRGCE